MAKTIAVAVLGGTGYGAGELLRYFCFHPAVEVVSVCSQTAVGESIESVHPQLQGSYQLPFTAEVDWVRMRRFERSVVISSVPHGKSGAALRLLATEHPETYLIDLSGDLRLRDEGLHRFYYPESEYDKDFRGSFVYGLSELARSEIARARHIANPGCLATAVILGLAPLRARINKSVAIVAQTGSSGAGRALRETTHHPSRFADCFAYKQFEHQHEPEILQATGYTSGEVSFVSQSLPIARGIYVTIQADLTKTVSREDLINYYREFYEHSPSVRIVDNPPHIGAVVGTNFCNISLHVRNRQVVCFVALDNLGKGMAGQAIQNMNIMCGQQESEGLLMPALGPTVG